MFWLCSKINVATNRNCLKGFQDSVSSQALSATVKIGERLGKMFFQEWSIFHGRFSSSRGIFEDSKESEPFIDRIIALVINKSPENRFELDNNSESSEENFKHSIIYSEDFFKTQKLLKAGGSRFVLTKHYLLITYLKSPPKKGQIERTQEMGIMMGELNSEILTLKPVELGFVLLKGHGYTVLESKEGRVFIQVSHSVSGINYGHIYVSDSYGQRFDLSLKYNVKNELGYCDFNKIEGIPNFYIANHYQEDSFKIARFQLEKAYQNNNFKTGISSLLIQKTKQTFDNGKTWHPIPAPSGSPPLTQDPSSPCHKPSNKSSPKHPSPSSSCSLHLHSLSSPGTLPPLSSPHSPGLLLATGNEGESLNPPHSTMNTYLSLDGGRQWKRLFKGNFVYEIGDQGGLIVLARAKVKTKSVLFSWDFGKSFSRLEVSQKELIVTSIKVSRDRKGILFLIYGIADSAAEYGIMIPVDFSFLMPRLCSNDNKPSDFEEFEIDLPDNQ